MRIADTAHSRRWHIDRIIPEIRHPHVAEQNAAVGMGIRAHASFTLGRKFG